MKRVKIIQEIIHDFYLKNEKKRRNIRKVEEIKLTMKNNLKFVKKNYFTNILSVLKKYKESICVNLLSLKIHSTVLILENLLIKCLITTVCTIHRLGLI